MKAIRLAALSLLTLPVLASASGPTASQILKTAEAKAARQHKKVFLIFHASWCGWCHKLDDMLNSPDFKHDFDSSYVIVHMTILENGPKKADETPGGKDMYNALGGKGGGIPFFAFFDSRGKKLGDSLNPKNIGYPSEPSEVTHFMALMKKTSKMSKAEQTKLEAFLSNSK